MKKKIMIFGDSNTWGWNPINDLVKPNVRWDDDIRWPGIMQKELGEDYDVIQEGLNGRTTVWDDPLDEDRCGRYQIVPTLHIHAPLDLAIIYVGTNDLKARFTVTAQDIAKGAGILVEKTFQQARTFKDNKVKILLICPPPLGPIENGPFWLMFRGGVEESRQMAPYFKEVAEKMGVEFFDAGSVIHSSYEDGVHLQADQHEILGKQLAPIVRKMIG